jgi:hypothetical protein
MAKFARNDWVKVVPTPDTNSDVWTSSHNKFCDKIGKIIDINDEYDDMLLVRVSVHFEYKQSYLTGEHSAWFEDKHLVKSSKWESDRISYLSDKFEEYRKFEASIKKKRDKILKDIFTDHEAKKREEERALREAKKAIDEIKEIEEKNDMEGWIYGDGWYVKDFDDI